MVTVTVPAGATAVAQQDLVLEKGEYVTIRTEDGEGYLDRHEGKTQGGFLFVGVRGGPRGHHFQAALSEKKGNSRKYRVLVPLNTEFRIRAQSQLFDLEHGDAARPLRVLQDLPQVIRDRSPRADVVVNVKGITPGQ